jgi:sugar/nucleoside kinase (ribokinase family)
MNFMGYNILYVEGYLIFNKELVQRACTIAKENNMKIALDLSSFNVVDAKLNDFREIVEKYVDIIFANEEESKSFTGLEPDEAIEILSALCETSVIKIGRDGSIIKRGDELIRIGTIPVNCVDTTGAGDLYASGFLYGYANGLSLEKCGLFGSILAGHVIEIVGARMDEHRWKKIMSLLKAQAIALEE